MSIVLIEKGTRERSKNAIERTKADKSYVWSISLYLPKKKTTKKQGKEYQINQICFYEYNRYPLIHNEINTNARRKINNKI